MKTMRILLLVLLVTLLGACKSDAVAPTAYPAPGDQPTAAAPSVLYPGIADGSEIVWDQAVMMLHNGEVAKAVQAQDLKVTLTLKDGRTLITTAPESDRLTREIELCGDKCKDIEVSTQ